MLFASFGGPLALWVAFGYRRHGPDDVAARVRLGPDSVASLRELAPAPSAHHFVVVCPYCHGIYKIADEHGVLVAQVGDTLKVSSGICPACEPRVQAELDRTLTALAHA